MFIVLLIGIVIAGKLGRKLFAGSGGAQIEWSRSMKVALPLGIAREAVNGFLARLNYKPVNNNGEVDVYARGDLSIKRLPASRDVGWLEVPILVACGLRTEDGRTVMLLMFKSVPGVTFSRAAARLFRQRAKAEFDAAIELLHGLAEELALSQHDAGGPPGAGGDTDQGAMECHAEFAALGLNPGASWSQVQAAYRDCCKKFHPDHLTAQNVAPHLVDLAVRRFKDASAAYQRLREFMR